jgi:hypothetical protein
MNLFKKLDEKDAKIQLDISNRAGKISLIFYVFALVIWAATELILNGPTYVLWIILLIFWVGFGIYLFSFIIIKKR